MDGGGPAPGPAWEASVKAQGAPPLPDAAVERRRRCAAPPVSERRQESRRGFSAYDRQAAAYLLTYSPLLHPCLPRTGRSYARPRTPRRGRSSCRSGPLLCRRMTQAGAARSDERHSTATPPRDSTAPLYRATLPPLHRHSTATAPAARVRLELILSSAPPASPMPPPSLL